MEEVKRCSTCHEVRALADFNIRQSAADGRQSRCRSCSRAWYVENRASHKLKVRRRNDRVRQESRQRLTDYLLQHPCVDCGEDDVRVLDFDHDDRTTKLMAVGTLVATALPWSRIEAEIAKCSVRCANCHRRRTAEQLGYWRHTVEVQRRAAAAADAGARLQAILPG